MKKILSELIAIPSYVDKSNNEVLCAIYIEDFLKQYAPWLTVERQYIDSERFNVVAANSSNPEYVFVSHMDTVLPSGKSTGVSQSVEKEGFIYGLGACDMKGGIAALLSALESVSKPRNIACIFDCGEEYDFAGIKAVLVEYSYKPKLVICPEPTDLKVMRGCRGLYEYTCILEGKTGHASQPELGVNAIEQTVKSIGAFKKTISDYDEEAIGKTSVNLAYLVGGRWRGKNLVSQANAIPDGVKCTLDIRTAFSAKSDVSVLDILSGCFAANELAIRSIDETLAYEGYVVDLKSISSFVNLVNDEMSTKDSLKKAKSIVSPGGFYEAAIISNAWKCPAISFGPGVSRTAHTLDERVDIKDLEVCTQVYRKLISLL